MKCYIQFHININGVASLIRKTSLLFVLPKLDSVKLSMSYFSSCKKCFDSKCLTLNVPETEQVSIDLLPFGISIVHFKCLFVNIPSVEVSTQDCCLRLIFTQPISEGKRSAKKKEGQVIFFFLYLNTSAKKMVNYATDF